MAKLSSMFKVAVLIFSTLAAVTFTAPSVQAARLAPNCSGGENCWWPGRNYTGTRVVLPIVIPSGYCHYWTRGSVRSYAHYGRQEGYFYSGQHCSGRAKATVSGSAGNVGFSAHSFKGACVSC